MQFKSHVLLYTSVNCFPNYCLLSVRNKLNEVETKIGSTVKSEIVKLLSKCLRNLEVMDNSMCKI